MITIALVALGLVAVIFMFARRSSRPKNPAALSSGTRASDAVPIWLMASAGESKTDDPAGDVCAGTGTADADASAGSDGAGGGSD